MNKQEKEFFDTFEIPCDIPYHQQYNGAQIARGLAFYKEREQLAKEGYIQIWHKMLEPRPENDCIYWGEYLYPEISEARLLELIMLLTSCSFESKVSDTNELLMYVLQCCLTRSRDEVFKQQVQNIFQWRHNKE